MAYPDPAHALRALTRTTQARTLDVVQRVQGKIELWINGPSDGVVPEALPFQPDLDEIIMTPPSRFLRSAPYLVGGMFLMLVLIAALTQVDIVVSGQGRLIPEKPPIILQPIERAIIREIKVKNGDVVTKGQVLALLDPTFAEADVASLSMQQRALLAQMRRLEAEAASKPFEAKNSADMDEALQSTLYRQRQQHYASRLLVFDEELKRLDASLRSTEDNRKVLNSQLEITKDLEDMRQSLMQSQTGSKLQLMEAQSVRMRAEREFQDSVNRISELKHGIQSKRAERQSFIDEWQRQLLEELVRVRTDASRINESLVKASRIQDFIVVTAPQDGVVLEVAKRSVGSIMREAEPLVSIVPSNTPLMAEIKLPSGEIGYAKYGDDAVIKVDAFPYLKHGSLDGRLRSISQESFSAGELNSPEGTAALFGKAGGGAFHRAEVEITANDLRGLKSGQQIFPGMTVTAEIKVGSRSVLGFFFSPLIRGVNESMREP